MFQYSLTGKDGSGLGSWKTVPAVPVPRSVPAKTVPTVPVSGSGSVPGPPCFFARYEHFRILKIFNLWALRVVEGRRESGVGS